MTSALGKIHKEVRPSFQQQSMDLVNLALQVSQAVVDREQHKTMLFQTVPAGPTRQPLQRGPSSSTPTPGSSASTKCLLTYADGKAMNCTDLNLSGLLPLLA